MSQYMKVLLSLLLIAFNIFIPSVSNAQTVQNWDQLAISSCQKLQPTASDCNEALVTGYLNQSSFSAPIVITEGGTYSGKWISNDPNVSAVTIQTSHLVKIVNSTIAGTGNLIYGRNVNVIIDNVSGVGLGNKPGKFLDATPCDKCSVFIANSRMSNVWGTRITGSSPSAISNISIVHNIAYNIVPGLDTVAHFFQLVNGTFPGANIANNIAINAPGKSYVEDVINIYNSRGTPALPINIQSNQIIGAYPLNPATDPFSGGGIIVDGTANATPATSSAYIHVLDNVVIDTSNYGVAIASGHDNLLSGNLVVSAGIYGNGIPVKSQNVGIYIWNEGKQAPSVFLNNYANQNKVYWLRVGSPNNQISNWWLPDCTPSSKCNNLSLSNIPTLTQGLAIEVPYIRQYFGQ